MRFLLKNQSFFRILILILGLFFLTLLFFYKNSLNPHLRNCWNDIDFKQMEQKLLTSPVRRKIPIYEYGSKNKKIYNKQKYKDVGVREVSILFFDNNLKAVFKPDEPLYIERSVRAYRFSNFMGFHFVPPTVIRTVNGKRGSVQLFVEGDSLHKLSLSKHRGFTFLKTLLKFFNLSHLYPHRFHKMVVGEWWDKYNNKFKNWEINSDTKRNMYIFYFISGIIDPSPRNILVSKKCKLPVLIDNDLTDMTWNQFGDWPFIPLPDDYRQYKDYLFNPLPDMNKNFSINSVEDFKTFPVDKVKFIRSSVLFKSREPLYGMEHSDFSNLKKFSKYAGGTSTDESKIYFVKWKNNYWVKKKQKVYYFIYRNPPSVVSEKILNQLKKLDEGVLRNLLLKRNRTRILGWLYRRNVIIEEALKQETSFKN